MFMTVSVHSPEKVKLWFFVLGKNNYATEHF